MSATVTKPAQEIPSTVLASLKSWWLTGTSTIAVSEERILRRLPFYDPSPTHQNGPALATEHGVVAHSSMVTLDNPKHALNTLSFTPVHTASPSNPVPVILHGYGAGLGFFYRNFPALGSWVAQSGTPLHAVDWLGMGRSSRPSFRIKAKREDTIARVNEAESFFVDSLEQWRQKMGLKKMTLVGHSLGAYLTVAYTLRYPEHVSRIVLLSPAGVPEDPNLEVPSREVDEPPPPSTDHASTPKPASIGRVSRIRGEQKEAKKQESRSRRLFTYLWEEGWSPFQVVRSTLFFGPLLVGKYSSRRFTGLTEEETREMHDYILNITLAKGSGEYSISHLLAPGAVARLPIVNRIASIKVPVTFVYGDHDWMDPKGGVDSVYNLREAGNTRCKTVIIPHAGHHVYLDNPDAVNELLIKELNKTVRKH